MEQHTIVNRTKDSAPIKIYMGTTQKIRYTSNSTFKWFDTASLSKMVKSRRNLFDRHPSALYTGYTGRRATEPIIESRLANNNNTQDPQVSNNIQYWLAKNQKWQITFYHINKYEKKIVNQIHHGKTTTASVWGSVRKFVCFLVVIMHPSEAVHMS